MDEPADVTLPEPVVVLRRPAARTSSMTWTLVPTITVLVGLSVLDALVLAVDVLGYGGLLLLAPIADSPVPAPDPRLHLVVLALAWAVGLVVAIGGSVAWDRRTAGPTAAPAAVRGLAVAAVAGAVATGIVLLGLGLA